MSVTRVSVDLSILSTESHWIPLEPSIIYTRFGVVYVSISEMPMSPKQVETVFVSTVEGLRPTFANTFLSFKNP